eukprot:SAG31_NODE_494_length_14867_cov_2.833762_7_plen_152_part_00
MNRPIGLGESVVVWIGRSKSETESSVIQGSIRKVTDGGGLATNRGVGITQVDKLPSDKVLYDAFPGVKSDGWQFRYDASGIPAVRSDGRQFTLKSSTFRSTDIVLKQRLYNQLRAHVQLILKSKYLGTIFNNLLSTHITTNIGGLVVLKQC